MSPIREQLESIFAAAVSAVDPRAAIMRQCRRDDHRLVLAGTAIDLGAVGRIVVVGAGKAAATMAQGIEDVLGDRLDTGVVVTKHGHRLPLARIRLLEAGHPVPDEASVRGAAAVLDAVAGLDERDLVIVLLSGGASALLAAPRDGLTLADKQAATSLLLASGADIAEMNTLRKKLSRVKGGQLARACAPARVVTLAVSDVLGDDWAVIGSGPTSPDPTSFVDAMRVCLRYDLLPRLPPAVAGVIERGAAGIEDDTPDAGDPCFSRGSRHLIASNAQAIAAAAATARGLGYDAVVWDRPLVGEAALAAEAFCARIDEVASGGRRTCLIAGGETTVTLGSDPGRGGRNQEFALAAACRLRAGGRRGIHILAAGTDGTDGPTDAAGGIVDASTCDRAAALGLVAADHLARHDAYPLLKATGDLLITGPTGTNVMDVVIALSG